jgi:23S rRNA (guanosine2251-2'-O)-methyltransferase
MAFTPETDDQMANEELIFGWHAVNAAMKYEATRIKGIRFDEGRKDHRVREFAEKARQLGIQIHEEPGEALDKMTGAQHHQGVVARCEAPPRALNEHDLPKLIESIKGTPLLLVLDQVQDPHNLGACIRSADAAGVHTVIAPKDNSADVNATVRKVASGAAETVPFVKVTNLARVLRMLKDEHGLQLVGAASEAETVLYDVDLSGPTAIIFGAEGKGMRRLTREACDVVAKIPMHGKVESVNISVAAGVFLFEAMRQRAAKQG